jgi:hypothetical protein
MGRSRGELERAHKGLEWFQQLECNTLRHFSHIALERVYVCVLQSLEGCDLLPEVTNLSPFIS